MHVVDKDRQPEDAKYNGGHGGEVRYVHFDDIGEDVLRCEFLKVNRSGNTDGKRQGQYHEHHEERPDHRDPHTGGFGPLIGGIRSCDEREVEALFQRTAGYQRIDEVKLCRVDALVIGDALARHAAFQVSVHAAVGEKVELDCGADQFGVLQHEVAQGRGRILRQQRGHGFGRQIGRDTGVRNLCLKCRTHQRRITESGHLLDVFQIAVAVLVEFRLQQFDRQRQIGLLERAGPARNDRGEQHHQHQQADTDGDDSVEAKPSFGAVAAAGARVLLHQQGRTARVCKRGCGVGDIAHSYCSRYLRTM